jgi:hypothetical protein
MRHTHRPELGDTIGVVTSTGVVKSDWSQDIRLESNLSTEVMRYLHYKHA